MSNSGVLPNLCQEPLQERGGSGYDEVIRMETVDPNQLAALSLFFSEILSPFDNPPGTLFLFEKLAEVL